MSKYRYPNSEPLNYDDKQDFKDCLRGYKEANYPPAIRNDGTTIWDMASYDFIPDIKEPGDYKPDQFPDSVDKSLWRQAQLNKIHGWFEVCEGVYQFRSYDMANLTLVETSEGIVVIDCTTAKETAETALKLYKEFKKYKESEPVVVKAVILTHTHTDHYGGIRGVVGDDQSIPVYAPEHFVTEAALENVIVGDAMSRRSTYQYGTFLTPGIHSHVDSGLGKAIARGGSVGFVTPNRTVIPNGSNASTQPDPESGVVYEELPVVIGEVQFEFMLCPHTEAPAEMTVYIHGKNLLVGAEILNHTLHNLLTPRGAEVRDARLWWKAIDKLITRYPDTEIVCATHHWPVWKYDEKGNQPNPNINRCTRFMEEQRDTYKFLHDQTVRLINKGYTMLEIAAWFDKSENLPDFMKSKWHNRGYYGTISHDVRAIYQKYLGWYDMNPSNLNPLPPEEVAKRYIDAIGEEQAYGVVSGMLNKDVGEYAEDYRWAAELGKHLVLSGRGTPVQQWRYRYVLAKVYEALGFICEAGTWRDMYLVGAAELINGGPLNKSGGSTANPAILGAIDREMFYDFAASRLNGKAATNKAMAFQVNMDGFKMNVSVANSVLNFHEQGDGEAVPFTITREVFSALILGTKTVVDVWGKGLTADDSDKDDITAFFQLFDHAAPNFNIVLPKADASVNITQKSTGISDGIYVIQTASSGNENLVVDVEDGYKGENGSVILFPKHGRENQQWEFRHLGDGRYHITGADCQKPLCLRVDSINPNCASIVTGSNLGVQTWMLEDLGGDRYRICSSDTGLYLDWGECLERLGVIRPKLRGCADGNTTTQEFLVRKVERREWLQ